tara:strand:+ start:108 stop:485 length:378 start_codon:yes stop_codon:yes gene_type:complete
MVITQTSQCRFEIAYKDCWHNSQNIRDNCTPLSEIDWNDKVLYVSLDGLSGYAINRNTHELTNVFSTVKGRGKTLVLQAISQGANNLDCFDGYLVSFYSALGFNVTKRETNWTIGHPDVVYMSTI